MTVCETFEAAVKFPISCKIGVSILRNCKEKHLATKEHLKHLKYFEPSYLKVMQVFLYHHCHLPIISLSPFISIYLCEAHSLCEALSLSISIYLCEAHSLCEALSLSPFISLSISIYLSLYLHLSLSLSLSISISFSISLFLYFSHLKIFLSNSVASVPERSITILLSANLQTHQFFSGRKTRLVVVVVHQALPVTE